jgi:hypothetical protein
MRSIALYFGCGCGKQSISDQLVTEMSTKPSIPCNAGSLSVTAQKLLLWYVANSVLYVDVPYVVIILPVAYSLQINIFYYSACGFLTRFCWNEYTMFIVIIVMSI